MGLGRTAVGLLEVRRQLAKDVEVIRPGPEQAERNFPGDGCSALEIAIIPSVAHRESRDRERRLLAEFHGRVLRAYAMRQRRAHEQSAARESPHRHVSPSGGAKTLST